MGYRLSLNWLPTDDVEVKFKYSQYDQERTGSVSATKVYLTPEEREAVVPNRSDFARTAYAITDIFYPQLNQESQRDFVTFKDNNFGRSADDGIGISFRPDGSDDSLENAVLDITWEVGDHLLTSITGYSGYTYEDDVDVDWLPLEFFRRVTINNNFDGLFPEFLSLVTPGNPPPPVLPQNLLLPLTAANSMVYVSFSQGFKSGGFTSADDGEPGDYIVGQAPPPGVVFTTPNENFEFDDETVDAFEIGGKHDLLDGVLRINWAAFYTEYDNLQTSIFNGLGFGVTNASSSEIQGVEIEPQWAASEGLVIGLNVAWLDATYADFLDGPCTAPQLDADPLCGTPAGSTSNDLSGEKKLYASDWSGSLTFDYERPLSGQLSMFASGEVNYRDDFQSSGDNDPLDMIDSYTKTTCVSVFAPKRWSSCCTAATSLTKSLINRALTPQYWRAATPTLSTKVPCSERDCSTTGKALEVDSKPAAWRVFLFLSLGRTDRANV